MSGSSDESQAPGSDQDRQVLRYRDMAKRRLAELRPRPYVLARPSSIVPVPRKIEPRVLAAPVAGSVVIPTRQYGNFFKFNF